MAQNWHLYDVKTLEKKLNTDMGEGLSGREASARHEKLLKREKGEISSLFSPKSHNRAQVILSFISTPSALLLLLISLLAAIFGKAWTGGLVFLITLVGALICGTVKLKAQKRLEIMNGAASPMVRVRRGGNLFHTDGKNLVVGDLILLSEGDILPCDARLVFSDGFAVDELLFTDGKLIKRRAAKDHKIGYSIDDGVKTPDAKNCVYAGSVVVSGEAIALVTDVGSEVYLMEHLYCGALAGKDSEAESLKRLKPLALKITFISISALLILSLLGLLTMQGYDFICVFLMLLSSVALITFELLSTCAVEVFSLTLNKLSKSGKSGADSVKIRNIKALDSISTVTDLVFVGRAGLTDGIERMRSVYTANGIKKPCGNETEIKRTKSCIFTYIKALRESGFENEFSLSGLSESLLDQIKTDGFDTNGASLSIKSLYFAPEGARGQGFACAETATNIYRTTLLFDCDAVGLCRALRDGDGIRNFFDEDRKAISAFEKKAKDGGHRRMYIISESDGTTVLEGIAAISEDVQPEISETVDEIRKLGINTCVFFTQSREEVNGIITDPRLSALFNGKIANADDFKNKNRSITDGIGEYCAYVGFLSSEYSSLIIEMRNRGLKVAAYGVDNNSNEIMAKADVAISCDNIDYTSAEHRTAFYERLSPSGRENNLRCSQQTRLLAKVLVQRGGADGGGIRSIFEAFKQTRGANILFSAALLLFAQLSTTVVSFSFMSVIVGRMLINPVHVIAFSIMAAILSLLIFSDRSYVPRYIYQNSDIASFPYNSLRLHLPALISKAVVAIVISTGVRIAEAMGVFGEICEPSFAIYVCVTLSLFAEVFVVTREYVRKDGKRRGVWSKVIVAYAALILVAAVTSFVPVARELFPYGIGSKEFFIVPIYVLLYVASAIIAPLFKKKTQK